LGLAEVGLGSEAVAKEVPEAVGLAEEEKDWGSAVGAGWGLAVGGGGGGAGGGGGVGGWAAAGLVEKG